MTERNRNKHIPKSGEFSCAAALACADSILDLITHELIAFSVTDI